MTEKAKIFVNKSKKGYAGTVKIEKEGKPTQMSCPPIYEFKDDSLNGKECEVEREKGVIVKILVDGREIDKKKQSDKPQTGGGQKKYTADKGFKKEYPKMEVNPSTPEAKPQKDPPSQNTPVPRSTFPVQELQDSFYINSENIPDYLKNIGIDKIDNFYLKFHKYPRLGQDDKGNKKFLFYKVGKKKEDANKSFKIRPQFGDLSFDSIIERQKATISKLGLTTESLTLSPQWRAVVGLGEASVYETSILLNFIYGIPFIPGQAIKGVVRNWIINEVFGNDELGNPDLEKAEKRALDDEIFVEIFGNQKQKGNIIFFDAFPTKSPTIEPDIMNPHYGDYYSGKVPNPADSLTPNPIFFLTVQNTPFNFYIGIRECKNIEIKGKIKRYIQSISNEENQTWKLLNTVSFFIKKSFEEHGIGAKTAVGYGRFT